jgi:hypothetical protein
MWMLLVWRWRLVCHVRLLMLLMLLLLVCVLAGACGFDLRAALVDNGLVLRVGGGVAAVECVVERSAEGFSCALYNDVSMCSFGESYCVKDLREYLLLPL